MPLLCIRFFHVRRVARVSPSYRWANQGQGVGPSAQGWTGSAKGRFRVCRPGWAGHRLACALAGDILPVASAQLCGSGFGPGSMPSPHHSSSKPPFSPGLLRKPFTSFDSPLINVPSICHLRPPLPTLSRGLPRTAPKSSTACLLRLPPGHSPPSPGLSPFPSLAGSRASPE